VDADRRINHLARRQHGLVTRQQVLEAGAHRRSIDRKLANGLWTPVRRGVFVVEGSPRTWDQSVLSACLAVAAPVVVSHSTAAQLWQLAKAPGSDAVHLLGPTSTSASRAGVVVHRTNQLHPVDRSRRRGIPVTSVARTIVDNASSLGASATGTMVDDALRRRLLQIEHLRACFARLTAPGRGGLGPVRQTLAERLPGYDPGESDLELRTLHVIRRLGLPVPVQQHRVQVGGRRFRLDLAYPASRIGIELDGWDPHGTRSAFDGDRVRDALLLVDGWRIAHFTSATPEDTMHSILGSLLDAQAA